jgi:hypothetical protein
VDTRSLGLITVHFGFAGGRKAFFFEKKKQKNSWLIGVGLSAEAQPEFVKV